MVEVRMLLARMDNTLTMDTVPIEKADNAAVSPGAPDTAPHKPYRNGRVQGIKAAGLTQETTQALSAHDGLRIPERQRPAQAEQARL